MKMDTALNKIFLLTLQRKALVLALQLFFIFGQRGGGGEEGERRGRGGGRGRWADN